MIYPCYIADEQFTMSSGDIVITREDALKRASHKIIEILRSACVVSQRVDLCENLDKIDETVMLGGLKVKLNEMKIKTVDDFVKRKENLEKMVMREYPGVEITQSDKELINTMMLIIVKNL